VIALASVRTILGDALDGSRDDTGIAKVYRRAIDGTFQAPAVVIGQPAIEEVDAQPCGIDRWSLPVHVVVSRPGGSEEQTQKQLEDVWTAVLGVLRGAVGGLPGQARVTRAEFGSLMVAGQAYPAQEITIEIVG
jgi:hypothetical protein